nr:YceI family protein [Sinorhizobium fredii]
MQTGKRKCRQHCWRPDHRGCDPTCHTRCRLQQGENPWEKSHVVGFSAQTKVKRSDFGMKSALGMIGDEVQLYIEIEGRGRGIPARSVCLQSTEQLALAQSASPTAIFRHN